MKYVRIMLLMVVLMVTGFGVTGCGTIAGISHDIECFSSAVGRAAQKGVDGQREEKLSHAADEIVARRDYRSGRDYRNGHTSDVPKQTTFVVGESRNK